MFAIPFYPHHIHIWQFKPKNICTIRVAKDFQKPYTPFFLVTHPLKMFPFGNIGKAQSFPKPQTFNYGSPVSNSPYTSKKNLQLARAKKNKLGTGLFFVSLPQCAPHVGDSSCIVTTQMAKHITMSKHYKCGASRQACVRQSLDRVSHDPAQGKKLYPWPNESPCW